MRMCTTVLSYCCASQSTHCVPPSQTSAAFVLFSGCFLSGFIQSIISFSAGAVPSSFADVLCSVGSGKHYTCASCWHSDRSPVSLFSCAWNPTPNADGRKGPIQAHSPQSRSPVPNGSPALAVLSHPPTRFLYSFKSSPTFFSALQQNCNCA